MTQQAPANSLIKNVILFGTLGVIGYVLYKKLYVPAQPAPVVEAPYDPYAAMYAVPPLPIDQSVISAAAPLPSATRPTDMGPYTQSTDYIWNKMNLSDSVLAALRLSWLQSANFYTAAAMALSGQGKIDYMNAAFDDFTIANYGNSTYTKIHPPVDIHRQLVATTSSTDPIIKTSRLLPAL